MGLSPCPVKVTTRIILSLSGDPINKPSFATGILGGGTTQHIHKLRLFNPSLQISKSCLVFPYDMIPQFTIISMTYPTPTTNHQQNRLQKNTISKIKKGSFSHSAMQRTMKLKKQHCIYPLPIGSRYGIFAYMLFIFKGKCRWIYQSHGCYGNVIFQPPCFFQYLMAPVIMLRQSQYLFLPSKRRSLSPEIIW